MSSAVVFRSRTARQPPKRSMAGLAEGLGASLAARAISSRAISDVV
jgi:hypothetical protein